MTAKERGNECATASRDARTFPPHLDKVLELRTAVAEACNIVRGNDRQAATDSDA